MEILGPCFHCSAGNAATVVLLRVEKWPGHAEPSGDFLFKKHPPSAEGEMWNHTRSEQNQESLLMSGRASETTVIDEKSRKVFRKPREGHCKALQQGTPWIWAQTLQAAAVSSWGCFLPRISSVWIKSCLVQDNWVTKSFTIVRIWSLGMLLCQPGNHSTCMSLKSRCWYFAGISVATVWVCAKI